MRIKKQISLSYNQAKEHILIILENFLTERQKFVFKEISENSGVFTASQFVRMIIRKYRFSETSVWHTIKKFKRIGLVEFGNGSMIELTKFGKNVSDFKNPRQNEKCKVRKVAVIAGTPVDTRFGIEKFRSYGFEVFGKHISKDPVEQTKLQISNPKKLTKVVAKACVEMEAKGADVIVIYCNSMAGAINILEVRKRVNIPVITPHDVYRKVAKKFNKIGVMAANCASTSNIEKAIVNSNSNATVVGYANLDIVNDIEHGDNPKQIVEKRGVDKFANIIDKNNIKAIILGCTHFPYFYDEIRKRTKAKVIEPSEEISKSILKVPAKQSS